MEASGSRKRFLIFQQLSNDNLTCSRGLQVVSNSPQTLAHELGQYGEIEMVRVNQRSVTVLFRHLDEAKAAYSVLSQHFRTFYFPESPLKLPALTPGNMPKYTSSSHRRYFSTLEGQNQFESSPRLDSSEADDSKNDFPADSAGPFQARHRLRKKPLDVEESERYKINLSNVMSDGRTTLMIRNIPNKYTQQMLLQTVDYAFSGQYDFFYLPIDFKNWCNVGYAFINFLSPAVIPEFHKEFNAKKWKNFNSDKICALTYARIQGKQALVEHFKSSSVMNQVDANVKPLILSHRSP